MRQSESSNTTKNFLQVHKQTTIYTTIDPPKVWERFGDNYPIRKRTQLENFFHQISNLHQKIKFTLEEESNEELAFLDTLLKWKDQWKDLCIGI